MNVEMAVIRAMNNIEKFTEHLNDYIFSDDLKDCPISILLSGGCDSIGVLHRLLTDLKKDGNDKRKINSYHIYHEQIGNRKMMLEKDRINSFLKYCKDNELPHGIHYEVPLHHINLEVGQNGDYKPQPGLWWSTIIPLIPDNSIICTGDIKHDDIWNWNILPRCADLFCSLSSLFGKKMYWLAPFKDWDKHDIVKMLKDNNLYQYTWYCEAPTEQGDRCGVCDSCRMHDEILWYLDRTSEIERQKKLLEDDTENAIIRTSDN